MKTLSVLGLFLSLNAFSADYTFHCKTLRDSSLYYGIKGEALITYSSNNATGIYDAFLEAAKSKSGNPIKSVVINYKKRNNPTLLSHEVATNNLKASIQSSSGVIKGPYEWGKPSIMISQFVTISMNGNISKPNSHLSIKEVLPSEAALVDFDILDCTDNGLKIIPESLLEAAKTPSNGQVGYEF